LFGQGGHVCGACCYIIIAGNCCVAALVTGVTARTNIMISAHMRDTPQATANTTQCTDVDDYEFIKDERGCDTVVHSDGKYYMYKCGWPLACGAVALDGGTASIPSIDLDCTIRLTLQGIKSGLVKEKRFEVQ
jgi:hypothetical protein